MPAKLGVHTRPGSFLHAMPGYLGDTDTAGLKWIGYYPDNGRLGVPAINGLIILNNAETGQPTAIMDANWITAYRTAAVSALSCRLLTDKQPGRLALIGYGVQAESHLRVFCDLFPLQKVSVWGPNAERCRQFVGRQQVCSDAVLFAAPSAEMAVKDADLVISVTPIGVTPVQQLKYEWLKPGAVVCPVEFDSAWDQELFQRASLLATDDLNQFEAYRNKGYFTDVPTPHADLAGLLADSAPPPERDNGIAVTVNLGIGLMDLAFAEELYRLALQQGLGTQLSC